MVPDPSIRTRLNAAWAVHRPLAATTLLMTAAFVVALVGLWIDPRTITGAPAWLKPAKFGISTALYGATLLWLFQWLPDWPRTRRVAGWTTAVVFVLEVGIIDLQAWRGTTSHFNAGTVFDGALFTVMGAAIGLQTLSALAVAVALWRQHFTDAAWGAALRLGMTLSVIGASAGGLMTPPTTAQLARFQQERVMPVVGGHTVGADDGGPGLPGTGWSLSHGDLRVPHFVGLHAVQVLPLLVVLLPRRWPTTVRTRLIVVSAAAYAGLFAVLTRQALAGEALTQPSPTTIATLITLGVATAAAAVAVRTLTGVSHAAVLATAKGHQ